MSRLGRGGGALQVGPVTDQTGVLAQRVQPYKQHTTNNPPSVLFRHVPVTTSSYYLSTIFFSTSRAERSVAGEQELNTVYNSTKSLSNPQSCFVAFLFLGKKCDVFFGTGLREIVRHPRILHILF
jgi:hypothetical protein